MSNLQEYLHKKSEFKLYDDSADYEKMKPVQVNTQDLEQYKNYEKMIVPEEVVPYDFSNSKHSELSEEYKKFQNEEKLGLEDEEENNFEEGDKANEAQEEEEEYDYYGEEVDKVI